MKKVYILVICLIGGLLWVYVSTRNHRVDDEISRAIYKELGKRVEYYGREVREDNSVYYKYYFEWENDQIIERIHAAAQEIIEQEGIDEKIHIACWYEFYSGAHAMVAEFYNYSEGSEYADLEGLQRLVVLGCKPYEGSIYNQADTYSGIQGIKYLQVEREMADVTEAENIDWYEYFPDLETLEVVPIQK